MNFNRIYIIFILFAFTSFKADRFGFSKPIDISSYPNTVFAPVLEKNIDLNKNTLYVSTLSYAWQELRDIFKGEKIIVEPKFKTLTLLNSSNSFQNSIDQNYLTKNVKIQGESIKIQVNFKIDLPFKKVLVSFEQPFSFNNQNVKSFGLLNMKNKSLFKILYYKHDNEFIVKINPKDTTQEIILYQPENPKFSTLKTALSDMNLKIDKGILERKIVSESWKYTFDLNDRVQIPKFMFNISNNYKDLVGKYFRVKSGALLIDSCYQTIGLQLNEKGAKVESSAYLNLDEGDEYMPNHTKTMLFYKPFLIVIKRKNIANPYFVAWITNAELMEKFK